MTVEQTAGTSGAGADGKLIAAVIFGTCLGNSGLMLLPFWIGAVVRDLSLGENLVGLIGSVQLTAAAVASLAVSAGIRSLNRRRLAFGAIAVLAIANLGSVYATDVPGLVAARALSGLGEGAVLAVTYAIIAGTGKPDRLFSITQSAMAAFAAIAFFSTPTFIASYGPAGVFGFVAVAAILGAALFAAFPAGAAPARAAAKEPRTRAPVNAASLAALLALAIWIAGFQTFWPYMEGIGRGTGLDLQGVGNILAAGFLISILGPVAAVVLGARFGRTLPLTAALLGLGLTVVVITQASSQFAYGAGAIGTLFLLLVAGPFVMGLLAYLDPVGRLAAAGPAFMNFGAAAGPALGAAALTAGGYPTLGWTCLALYLLAAVLLFGTARRADADAG